ncbi:MAG: peptide chain release factor N(5)-glutamine methyltransferase, partial [Oscillospiraceae bacterium]|nr:peptide chain release factor N(5)-glutamine methyltransferase [Oscillospiraceae bacterium]
MVIRELIGEIVGELSAAGADNARFDAECIMESAGVPRITLLTEPNMPVSDKTVGAARDMSKRRAGGEPLQYILGEWEFYGYPFKVGEGVLIPRQDTELAVEIVEGYLKRNGGTLVADLCAGSGCIGIALARRCGCRARCYELSETAFGYLVRNIDLNGVGDRVEAVRADVLTVEPDGRFDVIVTNPPYLTGEDMKRLQKEVSFEPKSALYGGSDGLDFYRGILPRWAGCLKKGGLFASEIGMGQE